MSEPIWLTKEELFPRAVAQLRATEVVLDIGPGIQPQQYIKPLVHLCAEPFDQYVQRLRQIAQEAKDRQYVILNMTWADVVNYLPEQSVDTVILSDVIEHLTKEEGRVLLEKTQKIARHQIGIFTTLGFVPQYHSDGKDAWGLDGGTWQEHKSGWLPEDFGEHWQVLAAREFHITDNVGQQREKPAGALWAIYTNPQKASENSFRSSLVSLWRQGVQTNNRLAVRLATSFLKFAQALKPILWPIVKFFSRPKNTTT